jgi:succinate-acetate transporter protein
VRVSAFDPSRSSRFTFPPLWLVPILLIAGFAAIAFFLSAVAGFLGLVVGLVVLWRLQPKVDDYVRARNAERD